MANEVYRNLEEDDVRYANEIFGRCLKTVIRLMQRYDSSIRNSEPQK